MSFFPIFSLFIAAWWLVLKFTPRGIIPGIMYQVWFALTLVCTLLLVGSTCGIVHYVGINLFKMSENKKQNICVGAGWFWYRYCLLVLNPQIKLHMDEETHNLGWKDAPPNCAYCANHNSNLDPFLCTAMAPAGFVSTTRSWYKSTVGKLPIFSYYFVGAGHFPVYFTSKKDGDFSTEKSLQKKTADQVDGYLSGCNGVKDTENPRRLAFFPEGAVNKHPEKGIQPVRIGGCSTLLQHKMTVQLVIFTGVDEVWPAKAAIGGFPGTVVARVAPFEMKHDGTEDAQGLADRMQKAMQSELDSVKKMRKKMLSEK